MEHSKFIEIISKKANQGVFWESIGPDGVPGRWEELEQMQRHIADLMDRKDFTSLGELLYNQSKDYVGDVSQSCPQYIK